MKGEGASDEFLTPRPKALGLEIPLTPHFVQLPALVKARQGATDGDRSSDLHDPSIKPNLGADA
jgi:hypothetical protein